MPKHDIDPVLRHLVRAVNESDTGTVPVTVSVHGTALTGDLIPQRRYFAELVRRHPLMSALEPSSGLLGKEYVKETESESDHHLHLLAARTPESADGLWRISLESIDGWTMRHGVGTQATDDRGPFARLLGTP